MPYGRSRPPGFLLAAALFGLPVFEARATGNVVPDSEACEVAGRTAERAQGIPDGLLLAIGQVESGRRDPLTRRVAPWPWTLNVAGQGRLFETREAALDGLRSSLAIGVRSIDVGCFQVNLLHHPMAFSSIEEALDPVANAAYAARFLAQLRAETGSWDSAVGRYHSGLAERGEPYRATVLARWSGAAAVLTSPVVTESRATDSSRSTASDRYVVRVTATLRLPHVWSLTTSGSAVLAPATRRSLPRVITASRS